MLSQCERPVRKINKKVRFSREMVTPKTKNKSLRRVYRAGRIITTRRKVKTNRLKSTARLTKKRPTTLYGFRKELALRKNNTSLNIESFALLEGVYSSY